MELLNYQQTAEFLCVPKGTLYSWVHHRTIPFVRLSNRVIRFDRHALQRWVDERRLGPEGNGACDA
ncbi:MAG: helix-turn-helix domain-containing protein [Polyangiales bacterium]